MTEFLKEAASKLDSATAESKKAALFFDDDPDGICSGALLVKYLEKKGIECGIGVMDTAKPACSFKSHRNAQ